MKLIIKCIDNVKYELPVNNSYNAEQVVQYVYDCIGKQQAYVYNDYVDNILTKTIIINSKHIISVVVEE